MLSNFFFAIWHHKLNAARILAGLATMGAIVSQVPDFKLSEVSVQNAVVVLTPLAVWLGIELRSIFAPAGHPADIQLAKKLKSKMSNPVLDLLREHDFINMHHHNLSDPILDIADTWRGVDHEFSDPALRRSANRFIEDVQALADSIAVEMSPHKRASDFRTVLLIPEMDSGEPGEHSLQAARKLNQHARATLKSYEEFVRVAKKRVPEIFQAGT